MTEPIGIITGVAGLITTAVKIGLSIRKFVGDVAIANTKIGSFLEDIESFARTLQLLKDTLEQERVKSSMKATGHIGNLWADLMTAFKTCSIALSELQSTLEEVNRPSKVFESTMRHLRLSSATEMILIYQRRIQTCKETIQVQLQIVNLVWNQVTPQELADRIAPALADQITPNLYKLEKEIERMAQKLNNRTHELESIPESRSPEYTLSRSELATIKGLRPYIRSAASVVASASSVSGMDRIDGNSVLGDLLHQPSEATLRFLDAIPPAQSTSHDAVDPDDSDNDDHLENEIIQKHLQRGKTELKSRNWDIAQRLFQKCLDKLPLSESCSPHQLAMRLDLLHLLADTFVEKNDFNEAERLLKEKLAIRAWRPPNDSISVPNDMVTLSLILLSKKDYTQAQSYAKRAYKTFLRAGTVGNEGVQDALGALKGIAEAQGDLDEVDAYLAMLSDFHEQLDNKSTNENGFQSAKTGAISNLGEIETPGFRRLRSGISVDAGGAPIQRDTPPPKYSVGPPEKVLIVQSQTSKQSESEIPQREPVFEKEASLSSKPTPEQSWQQQNLQSYTVIHNPELHRQAYRRARQLMWEERDYKKAEIMFKNEAAYWRSIDPQSKGAVAAERSLVILKEVAAKEGPSHKQPPPRQSRTVTRPTNHAPSQSYVNYEAPRPSYLALSMSPSNHVSAPPKKKHWWQKLKK